MSNPLALAEQFLCPFQRRWINDPAPLALWEKSRRIGATWAQALRMVLGRIAGGSNYYHSSTDQTASVEFIDYCSQWAKLANAVAKVEEATEVVDDKEVSSLVMHFENGRKIVAGSSNPKFFRSKGGEVGLDEFAFHRDGRDLFKAAHATAMFWGHPLRAWSSHNGEGSFFNYLVTEVRAGRIGAPKKPGDAPTASVHRVTIEDAVNDGIVERVRMRKLKLDYVPEPDPGARRDWIDELRSTCPDQETWNEEYLCIPSSGGNTFLPADLIRSCEEPNLQVIDALDTPALELLAKMGRLYAGYDVGRTRDLSVLCVGELIGDVLWTRVLIRLKNTTYQAQLDILQKLLALANVVRLDIDKGLMGGPLAEFLQDRFGKYRVEGVQLTAPVQSELAMPLRAAFEDRSIRLPADPQLREALRKPRKLVVGNNVRFETPRDEYGHCDEFWALVLMLAASDKKKMPLRQPVKEIPVEYRT